jgi:hypothetical protein
VRDVLKLFQMSDGENVCADGVNVVKSVFGAEGAVTVSVSVRLPSATLSRSPRLNHFIVASDKRKRSPGNYL